LKTENLKASYRKSKEEVKLQMKAFLARGALGWFRRRMEKAGE
jgi:hypothetical protein